MIEYASPPYKIALVAPYGNLSAMFARVAEGLPCSLAVRMGVALEEAVAAARQLINSEQPEVICSRGGSADYIQSQVDVPVVTVSTTALDLLRVLLPFQGKIRKAAFFNYQEPLPEVQAVARALGMEIREYLFHTREEKSSRMLEAAAEGAQLGVGGALVAGMRELCGVDGIVLEAGEDAVRRALREAFAIARIRRVELQRQARTMTILNTIAEGIMVTDENNALTLINPAAENILQIKADETVGRDARDVVPNTRTWNVLHNGTSELNELQDINGQTIVTNRVPIRMNGRSIGVVCTFAGAERIRQAEQRLRGRQRAHGFEARWRLADILTRNAGMKDLKKLAAGYAEADASVLIQGESGSGKELFAQGMHLASRRAAAPFVAVNCAAIPPSLLESELFGYEEGAFTGARRKGKAGYFELAHEGTLFLDEISEMPYHLQARLLRVLQEREVMRVGGAQMIPIDVRIICATNRNLQALAARGLFRQDLFYRCNVLPLHIPPLRERGNDILYLACHFLRKGARGAACTGLDREALDKELGDLLREHAWPGNVRELANVMERLALISDLFPQRSLRELFSRTRAQESGPCVCGGGDPFTPPSSDNGETLREIARRAEYEAITRQLSACNGDYARAARRLGISRVSLWRKLRERPNIAETEEDGGDSSMK
ncbi:sigma 54-interacting transcriptional regulator [Desulfovibrio sp.]|mgnify:CR=1 FL=1|uniref:sigma 54-interacting transcriptional regulator n=1 Tax=Desulfovibrio sp. TaxID=885 RepID=UPI0025BAC33C|nr:sigma 54-interacting transcriptional regulator [Desulfovibrio sp.]